MLSERYDQHGGLEAFWRRCEIEDCSLVGRGIAGKPSDFDGFLKDFHLSDRRGSQGAGVRRHTSGELLGPKFRELLGPKRVVEVGLPGLLATQL